MEKSSGVSCVHDLHNVSSTERRKPPLSKTTLLDPDRMASASRVEVSRTCVEVFDRVQTKPREHQLLGLACAFILMCEALRVRESDAFATASRIMADKLTPSGRTAHFDAMKYHLETELTRNGELNLGVER